MTAPGGRRRGLAAVLSLLATAEAAPDTLTLAEARALPADTLARRVLGAAGGPIRSTHVSAGVGMFANPYRLSSVELATAPRSAGFSGLCRADTYLVRFRPVEDEGGKPLTADLPSAATALDLVTRFRAVDVGPAPANGWDEAYGTAVDAACAATGPVLRPDGTSPFFINLTDGGYDARGVTASMALAVLAAAATPAPGATIGCRTSLPGHCRDQIRDLARSAPDQVGTGACDKAPRRRCVVARYDRGWLHWMTLTIESDAGPAIVYGTPPAPIRTIRVDEVQAVE